MPTLTSESTVHSVRAADQGDIPWILEQLAEFDHFAGYKRPLLEDPVAAAADLEAMIRNHVFLIAECYPRGPEGTPIDASTIRRTGLIAGYRSSHPFNRKLRVLTEAFWWVALEHRNTRAGVLLLDAFLRHGAEDHLIIMSLLAKSPVDDRILLKRGFHAQETSYVREV